MEVYLRTLLSAVDSSLADEWERMRNPDYQPMGRSARGTKDLRPPGAEEALADITRDTRAFTAACRTRIFTFLRAWSIGQPASALAALDDARDAADEPWTAERLRASLEAYQVEHGTLRLDPEARNLRHTYVETDPGGAAWRVQQMLVDAEMVNDWVAEFDVDLVASRALERPHLRLLRLGPLA
jgi:hypothetical protein